MKILTFYTKKEKKMCMELIRDPITWKPINSFRKEKVNDKKE